MTSPISADSSPGARFADRSRREAPVIELKHLTERVLLGALREQDAADAAEARRREAQFLADAGLALGVSLEKELTYQAIANLSFPRSDAWCIVDVIESDGGLRRVAVIHPDPLRLAEIAMPP